MPAPTPPQLSLFEDSQAVVLRNDAAAAVAAGDLAATVAASQHLARHCPGDALLAPLAVLQAGLQTGLLADLCGQVGDTGLTAARFGSPAEADAAAQAVQQAVAPAARAVLAADAVPWLRARWAALARRAAALPFDPAWPAAHAAALWLQAGDAPAAVDAVATIPSWRRQPVPLGWMLRATHASHGLDHTWPLLAELAWMSPPTLHGLLPALADPLLARLLRSFDEQFEAEADDPQAALAWFPAWLLVEKPALLARLREAEPGQASAAERGFRRVAGLMGLEQQGRQSDIAEERRRLRQQQPSLYAAYLRRR